MEYYIIDNNELKNGGIKVKNLKRIALALTLALLLTIPFASPVMAATSEGVTVTATPAYVAMSNDPDTWTLNDIVGDGVSPKGTIAIDTIYYSNPYGDGASPATEQDSEGADTVIAGECRFTITNTSTITTDVFVVIGSFTGGSANMTNSDDGSNGATAYGAYSYCTGMTYSTGKVVCKSSGSAATKEDLAPTTDIKWGLALETQTDAWAGGSASTATMTVSLVAA